jgi:hypothetical protein
MPGRLVVSSCGYVFYYVVFFFFGLWVAVFEGQKAHLARRFPGCNANMVVVAVQGPPMN